MLIFQRPAIRRLQARDAARLTSHLVRLDRDSRRQRFGYVASDATLAAHVERCFAHNAIIYGYVGDGRIRGVGELHFTGCDPRHPDMVAELALSVDAGWCGRGVGAALMKRILTVARCRQVAHLQLNCSPENDAMMALARKHAIRIAHTEFGLRVDLRTGGSDVVARFGEMTEVVRHLVRAAVPAISA